MLRFNFDFCVKPYGQYQYGRSCFAKLCRTQFFFYFQSSRDYLISNDFDHSCYCNEVVLYNNNTILALGINTRAKLNKYTFIKSRFWFRDTPLKLSGAVTRIYQLVGIAIIQKCFSNYHEPVAIPQEKKGITGYKMVRCFQMGIKFEDENFKSTIYTYLKPPYGKLSWSLA